MPKHFVSTKNQSIRMFESPFLEFFTKVHWSVPLVIYVPVVIFQIVEALRFSSLSPMELFYLFAGGLFIWSFTEYFLHRFVFHFELPGKWGKRIHFIIHGVHHDYPNDTKRLVMPPLVSIPLAYFFYILFGVLLPPHWLNIFFAGFITGYIIYDMMHYAIHHAKIDGKFWRRIQKNHLNHHFKDPNLGFGVSTDIWDKIIGTTFKEKAK